MGLRSRAESTYDFVSRKLTGMLECWDRGDFSGDSDNTKHLKGLVHAFWNRFAGCNVAPPLNRQRCLQFIASVEANSHGTVTPANRYQRCGVSVACRSGTKVLI